MPAPSLRIPLSINMDEFNKNIESAKSATNVATDFMLKQFAKAQLKLVVSSDEFKPGVQAAAKFVGDEFQKVKPLIQSGVQTAVRESTQVGLNAAGVLASPAIKGSFQAFTAVGVPAVAGLAQAMIPLALRALAVYEAIHLVAEVIGSAREQITAMVAVADKAANLNVSPQFLQLFEGESRKLKVSVEDLDGALSNAFNATKEKSPIDIGKWEVAKERINDVELALRVYNDQLAKPAGAQLGGLTQFRDAQTQDEKVKAVLAAMVQLDGLGQHLASLDLGEKMFGASFVDKIRLGKTSAAEILTTMERLKSSGDGIFSDALVVRAKAVDDQLKLSQDRLSRAMKPAWDDLAGVILTIKGYWADVVDLMAKAVEYANKLTGASDQLASKRAMLKDIDDRLNGTSTGVFSYTDAAARKLNGGELPDFIKQNLLASRAKVAADINNSTIPSGQAAAAPTRGVGDAPTLRKKDKDTETRDPFDVAVDGVEKHIATLKADTAAVFQNSAAQAGLRAEFQELTALKRADGGVTQQQIDAYEKYRQTMSATAALQAASITLTEKQKEKFLSSSEGIKAATEANTKANESLQKLNSASQQLGSALSSAFTDAIVDGKKFSDVLNGLLKTLEKAALNSLFASFFNAPAAGGLSPAAGLLKGIIPGFANGTDYAPGGVADVGERGPERVILPRGSQVIPNDVLRSRGGGGANIQNTFMVAGEVSPGTVDRLAAAVVSAHRKIDSQARIITSSQRMQLTGVS
jgi:hypothetical protein